MVSIFFWFEFWSFFVTYPIPPCGVYSLEGAVISHLCWKNVISMNVSVKEVYSPFNAVRAFMIVVVYILPSRWVLLDDQIRLALNNKLVARLIMIIYQIVRFVIVFAAFTIAFSREWLHGSKRYWFEISWNASFVFQEQGECTYMESRTIALHSMPDVKKILISSQSWEVS